MNHLKVNKPMCQITGSYSYNQPIGVTNLLGPI